MVEVSQSEWEKKEKRSMRGLVLSYAKDLVCEGKLSRNKMLEQAQQMFAWVWGENNVR